MKRLLGVSLLAGLVATAAMAAEPLTGFQQFRSYPFLDRAYREAGRDNWAEVERLMRHLLERVPRNDEARSLLVEALAKQRRYREAGWDVAVGASGTFSLSEPLTEDETSGISSAHTYTHAISGGTPLPGAPTLTFHPASWESVVSCLFCSRRSLTSRRKK